MKIKLSINRNLINKGNPWQDGWQNAEMSPDELLAHIREGFAFSQAVLKEGVGTKKPEVADVIEAWLVPVDIDNTLKTWNKETKKYDERLKSTAEGYYSLEDVKVDAYVNENALFVYTTPNHTAEHHRFRIVFLLNEPISSPDDYKRIATVLINKFQSDKSCNNIDRLFYGSAGCKYRFIGKSISIADLDIMEPQAKEQTKEIQRYKDSNLNGTISEELAAEMLACIPGNNIGYYEWFGVLSAIGNYFDESTALRLIEGWAPDEKYGTAYKLKHRGVRYGMGTLIHMAKQYGFDTNILYGRLPDASQINKKVRQILNREEGVEVAVAEVEYEDKGVFKHPLTESGNAERFVDRYKDKVIFNHTAGLWHIWNGHKWEIDLKREILNYGLETVRYMLYELAETKIYYDKLGSTLDKDAEKTFKKFIDASESRAKLESMIYLATGKIGVIHSDFDKDLYLVNTLNYTYNLKSGEAHKHNPAELITKACNVDYDADAICPHWIDFLETIFADDQGLIEYIQRAIGLSLCGVQNEEILFFCYGSGKNGKSVFFNVINLIFGDYFQKAPTEMLLMKHNESIPNDIARLPGSRIVVAEELPENRTLNENKIKNLTGGDSISARFLHKEFFDFKPTHTLWIYGNHKPNIKGTDEGIWRRINLIPFLVTIPEANRRPQHILMEEFEKEKSGIFNWILEGWHQYQEQGLNPPQIVLNYTKEYRDEQDQVADFLNEMCEFDVLAKVKKIEVLNAYFEWCKNNQEHPLRKSSFYKRVDQLDGVKSFAGTNNVKSYSGIKIRGAF